MKKWFIIVLMLGINLLLSANVFDVRIAHAEDEKINDIIEYPDFFILSGSIKSNGNINTYIIKLSKQGVILSDTSIQAGSIGASILKIDNEKFAVISSNFDNYPSDTKLEFLLMDTSLTCILRKDLLLPDSLYAMQYYSKISEDSTILISGVLNKYTTSIPINLDPFLYKTSKMGDSITYSLKPNNQSTTDRCFQSIELGGKQYVFMSFWESVADGSILVVDNYLNSFDTISILNNLFDSYSPLLLDDSSIVISTLSQSSDGIYISKIDLNGSIGISKILWDDQTNPYPSYQNSLSRNNDFIFSCSNKDFPLTAPFYGMGRSTKISVCKMDFNLNKKWIWEYGGDGFYHAYNILATKDRGCVVIGNVNDTLNHNYNRDLFIIKLDSNGTTTWIKNVTIASLDIKVFPNPAKTYINLQLPSPNQSVINYQISDIQGKLYISKNINAKHIHINISKLPIGMYIINGYTNSGYHFRSRFIKD